MTSDDYDPTGNLPNSFRFAIHASAGNIDLQPLYAAFYDSLDTSTRQSIARAAQGITSLASRQMQEAASTVVRQHFPSDRFASLASRILSQYVSKELRESLVASASQAIKTLSTDSLIPASTVSAFFSTLPSDFFATAHQNLLQGPLPLSPEALEASASAALDAAADLLPGDSSLDSPASPEAVEAVKALQAFTFHISDISELAQSSLIAILRTLNDRTTYRVVFTVYLLAFFLLPHLVLMLSAVREADDFANDAMEARQRFLEEQDTQD